MNSDSKPWVAILLVVILFGAPVLSCFWPQDAPEEELTFTGKVTGLSSYNQPKLDIKADELFDKGIELGAEFRVETQDRTFEDAIFMKGYLGLFMFDIYVNIENDGYVSIGCMGKLITADEGSEITLTKTGTSDRYQKTPQYNKGHTNNRADYQSDEQFANFYEVTGGDIKPGILYRSFSPLYDPAKQSRSPYVNELAEKANIKFEIALSYSDSSVAAAVKSLDGYCLDLCENGDYVAPSMGYLYFQQKEKTVKVLDSILENDGAYLIHCNVGRDRTGFTCLLLQALCGCTADEMKADEAKAFCNLCNIEVGFEEYRAVCASTYDRNMFLIANPDKIDDIFEIDWKNIDVSSVDTYSAAYNYCTGYLGMSESDVNGVIAKLCGEPNHSQAGSGST